MPSADACRSASSCRNCRQDDAERHVSPKAFELLRLLVENRPRALSKAELHQRLWPSVFVSEATLSSLVAEVRAALDEKAGDEGFVRTVHRFGYDFKGEAAELGATGQTTGEHARCWIIWESGQVPLREGDHLLGRDADVTVWLESPTVSRHHARIRITGPIALLKISEARTEHPSRRTPDGAGASRRRRCDHARISSSEIPPDRAWNLYRYAFPLDIRASSPKAGVFQDLAKDFASACLHS